MRFQVPQFVDIADKIIGPLTLKQFFIYLGTSLLLIPVFLFSDISLFITIALPALGIATAFAFLKINGRPLATVIAQGAQYYTRGNLFIWRRLPEPKPIKLSGPDWAQTLEYSGTENRSISGIARQLETEGNTVKSEDVEDPFDTA